ncbi:MAG: CapA family protein, partial [Clostridia bacterium]|nr:CapA family protein [Clostridia bacterium]
GAGENLEEATRHCKVQTEKGSLALVAVTSTCDLSARACEANGNILARPGVSMLRHSEKYFVTEEQLKMLHEIADSTKVNGRANNARSLGSLATTDGVFPFGPLEFALGNGGKITVPDPYDMARLEKAVKAAGDDADRVVVYVHSHEIKGDKEMEPDYFIETFARACIDWGADAVVCSGTHQIKAVEIYNQKPIYYSIANFFFRPYNMDYYPTEWYEKYGIDKNLTVAEAERFRSKNGTIGLFTQAYCFRCIAPIVEWDDNGNITKIAALPLSLGFHDSMKSKGFPRIAKGEDVEALFLQLKNTCEPYGTKVTLNDGLFEFSVK